jgi:hypothetical protein
MQIRIKALLLKTADAPLSPIIGLKDLATSKGNPDSGFE